MDVKYLYVIVFITVGFLFLVGKNYILLKNSTDYCNSALAGVPKVYLQKLQSVQNWLLELCLGCTNVITLPQFLKTYTGCQYLNEWSSRRPCWSRSDVSAVLLRHISETSAYPPHPRQVDNNCGLQQLEL